ncbi:MAG: efflux RND transporter periplasmic adaptor subunit, partial [Ignavibacteriaceae bacterium]|nr:efflux RND transporter periplasmic adaptor subunit [Ignavibacteriaceae bacterium]
STAAQRNAPVPVNAVIAKPSRLDNKVNTSGTIIANEEVELRPEVAGKITRISFKEGSFVTKGTMLIKINDEELQAQLKRADYRLKLLSDKEARQKTLLAKEAISQEEYDESLNELNIIKAEVELVKAQIAKTEIKAPFSGYIGLKNISEGSFVNTSTIIASLQEINPVKIDFSIPERYASLVSAGDEILFKTAGGSEQLKGKVLAIEPKIETVTRSIKIRGIYYNAGRKVVPGSFADVELVLKQIDNAILIPSQAIIPELKGQKVFLYRSGTAFPQPVQLGIRSEKVVQVVDGLAAGDTVITSGILQLRPGAPVTLLKVK